MRASWKLETEAAGLAIVIPLSRLLLIMPGKTNAIAFYTVKLAKIRQLTMPSKDSDREV